MRRRAFHNSLFPGPHALTGPRPPPCNPSHAPLLLFARCLLRPRMLLWAMYLALHLPPTKATVLPSQSRYRYLDLSLTLPTFAPCCCRQTLPFAAVPSVAGAGVLALPSSLPWAHSPLSMHTLMRCLPLSGVIPTPILAAAGWPPTPAAAPRLPQPTNLTLHLPTAPLPLPFSPLVLILLLFGPATVSIAPKLQDLTLNILSSRFWRHLPSSEYCNPSRIPWLLPSVISLSRVPCSGLRCPRLQGDPSLTVLGAPLRSRERPSTIKVLDPPLSCGPTHATMRPGRVHF